MLGFAILHGPMNREHDLGNSILTFEEIKHILSPERLPFSLAYFGSLGLTLYFAIGLKTKIGALIAAIVQVRRRLVGCGAWVHPPTQHGIRLLTFTGRCLALLRRCLLPWWHAVIAIWIADAAPWCWQCPSVLRWVVGDAGILIFTSVVSTYTISKSLLPDLCKLARDVLPSMRWRTRSSVRTEGGSARPRCLCSDGWQRLRPRWRYLLPMWICGGNKS